VTRAAIDASGSFGIGTVIPDADLVIRDVSAYTVPPYTVDLLSFKTNYKSRADNDSSKFIMRSGIYVENPGGQDLPQLQFANFVRAGGGSNVVMTLRQNNIGIGVTAPAGVLDVSASTANPAFFRTPTYMRVPIQDISAAATTSATVSLATSGLYYNITNSAFNTISLVPSITTASAGAFWVFRNNTAGTLSVTISNRGTAPSTIGTPISIPSSNSITIAVSAFSNDCYVLL
jgi:hypothetical protein